MKKFILFFFISFSGFAQKTISYADFGTKNQRITQIDYVSPTIPGIIARKSIAYIE